MAVTLRDPGDLSLPAYRRIAWEGEGVELHADALARIDERRRAFASFVDEHRDERLYGVTTAHHRGASRLLSTGERAAYARRVPPVPATFGPLLPERLVRGIVAARLSGFVSGEPAVRPELARAVAAMLDGPMPPVPARGHGDPGEIIALGATFAHLEDVVALEAKEGMALVNGSPCAAAALADAALTARGRLDVIEETLALALEAARSPHAHVDRALDVGRPVRGRRARPSARPGRRGPPRAAEPPGRGLVPRRSASPRMVPASRRPGRGVCRHLALRTRRQPDLRAVRRRRARAPPLERRLPRSPRGACAECAGSGLRGPREPRLGAGDPARGGSWRPHRR